MKKYKKSISGVIDISYRRFLLLPEIRGKIIVNIKRKKARFKKKLTF